MRKPAVASSDACGRHIASIMGWTWTRLDMTMTCTGFGPPWRKAALEPQAGTVMTALTVLCADIWYEAEHQG